MYYLDIIKGVNWQMKHSISNNSQAFYKTITDYPKY